MEGSAQVGCQDWDLHVSKYGPVCVFHENLTAISHNPFFLWKEENLSCFYSPFACHFLQMVYLRLIVQFVPSAPLIFSVDLHIFRPRIQDLPFNIFISLSSSFSHFVLLQFPFLFPFLPTLCAFAEVTTAVVKLSCGPGVKWGSVCWILSLCRWIDETRVLDWEKEGQQWQ